MKKEDFRLLVHTPAELGQEYLAWAERVRSDGGIRWGIEAIDRVVLPMRAGDEISIIGRPGDGKTSILAYLARQEAARIIERGAAEKQAVVYVTWEQSAEELEAFFHASSVQSIADIAWGRADLEKIREQAVRRASVPIWVIGHGIGRATRRAPRMTPDAVLGAIEAMEEDFGIRPTLMLFDYLQMIPVAYSSDRLQQVTEATIRIKELALRIGAPAVCGVQAKREVDARAVKLAEMDDGQWSSCIEQTSDKVFSLWRPARTEDRGSLIRLQDGTEYIVSDTLLIIRLLKQRGERGRHTWAMYFDPAYLKLAELETRYMEEP